jgi:hypothetical protein
MRIVLVGVLCVACSSSTEKNVVGTGATQMMMIGPEGGSVSLEGTTLTVPAGALASPVPITITSTTASIARYQQRSPIFQFDPDGLELAQPATLTLTAPGGVGDARLLTTVHPAGPQVAWFQDMYGTVSGKTISATMRHFSDAMIAHLPPCSPTQTATYCEAPHCGDSGPQIDEDVDNAPLSFLGMLGLSNECICHCDPCGADGSKAQPTLISLDSTEVQSVFGDLTIDNVACDTSLIEFVDTEKQFSWKVSGSTASISDSRGTTLYQGTVPSGFTFALDGTLPSIPMSSLTTSEIVTAFGPYICQGPHIPTPSSPPADMAMATGGPPMITGIVPSRAMVGSVVEIMVTGLNSVSSVQFNGVTAPGANYSLGSIQVTVPSGTTSGFITVVADTGTATSVPLPFIVTPKTMSLTGTSPATATPGSPLTLVGTDLLDIAQFSIEGNNAFTLPPYTASSTDTALTFTVPPIDNAILASQCQAGILIYSGFNGSFPGDSGQSASLTVTITGNPPACP